MTIEQKILSELQSEFERRLYTEGYDRIVQCLGYLSDEEVCTEGGVSKVVLTENLKRTIIDAQEVIERLNAEDLVSKYEVQVYEESGMSIVMHVIEHFSYHVGQITYAVKSLKNIDTQYYKEDLG